MEIPLEGYAYVKVYNMSVVRNLSVPELQLKKKSNSIAYHFVRQLVVADVARVSYEPGESNLADMLTKIQAGTTRQRLARWLCFEVIRGGSKGQPRYGTLG